MSDTTTNAKKRHTISIRISDELYAELNAEKDASGKTLSQIVIDRVNGCKPITILEGGAIATYLFDLRNMLDGASVEDKKRICETLNKIVDVLLQIEEKYLESKEDKSGNRENNQL